MTKEKVKDKDKDHLSGQRCKNASKDLKIIKIKDDKGKDFKYLSV